MDLTHSFAVPSSIDVTWTSFQDIAALAECFPGAQVTSVGATEDGSPTFEGTCKVKLGPIALVYAGSGSFVERDEATHRFVVEAKGRDKRGNGTAGAKVTVSMGPADQGTQVDVRTDLAITGKPAQFGRGVMQDVSDKLLGQFVACLERKLGSEFAAGDQDGAPASEPTGAAAVAAAPGDPDAGPASVPQSAAPAPASRPSSAGSGGSGSGASEDDALDLGSALLPILVKSYGKQVVAALVALLGVAYVARRLRR